MWLARIDVYRRHSQFFVTCVPFLSVTIVKQDISASTPTAEHHSISCLFETPTSRAQTQSTIRTVEVFKMEADRVIIHSKRDTYRIFMMRTPTRWT